MLRPHIREVVTYQQRLDVIGEEYGDFRHWEKHKCSISGILWNQFYSRWKLPKAPKRLSPLATDMAFFKEFRYRFDPSWRPVSSEEELCIYGNVVRQWTTPEVWQLRPWRGANFPQQPRWRFIEMVHQITEEDQRGYETHQGRCGAIRRALKKYPRMLLCPDEWLYYLYGTVQKRGHRVEDLDKDEPVDIELLRYVDEHDLDYRMSCGGRDSSKLGRDIPEFANWKEDVLHCTNNAFVIIPAKSPTPR
jgi:hypothetical protein